MNVYNPPLRLLVKLGIIARMVDRAFDQEGSPARFAALLVNWDVIGPLLSDPELRQWLAVMAERKMFSNERIRHAEEITHAGRT